MNRTFLIVQCITLVLCFLITETLLGAVIIYAHIAEELKFILGLGGIGVFALVVVGLSGAAEMNNKLAQESEVEG